MSVGVTGVHRFDECYSCFRGANEINNGLDFQVIGHLTEQAGCIHAVCLPCIQAEDASRARSRPANLSMRQACGMCRAPLGNNQPAPETVGVQGRLFTVLPFGTLGEDGRPVMTPSLDPVSGRAIPDQFDHVFHGEVINSADMPPDSEPLRVPVNINNLIDNLFPDIRERLRAREAERIRRSGMSRIEITCETIGRELVGRVVSLVLCGVAGAAFGVAYYGAAMAANNALNPEEGVFVPREELDGLSPGFVVMLVGGAVFGIYCGVMGAFVNPCGDTMGRAGALTGKAIVSGLEGLNGQIERINRAWANLFVDAAQLPAGG